jgi:hypothetical protein
VTTPTNQVPNGTIQQGQIWTPAQWNTAWQSKVDAIGGFSTNETLTTPDINDPTIVGGTQSSPAITTPAITGGTMSAPNISNPTITGEITGPGAFSGPVTGSNITSGTFTATLTGMTTTVTAPAVYAIVGDIATITIPFATGTSNSSTFTLTGIPSAIQPASSQPLFPLIAENAGLTNPLAYGQLLTGGTIQFNLMVVVGSLIELTSNAWAASGTKGFNVFTATYSLQ